LKTELVPSGRGRDSSGVEGPEGMVVSLVAENAFALFRLALISEMF